MRASANWRLSTRLSAWWTRTRPDQPEAKWIEFFNEEEYVDSEELGLLEYLIRLAPLTDAVPVPPVDDEHAWCGTYELRRPEPCPEGIPREPYGTA